MSDSEHERCSAGKDQQIADRFARMRAIEAESAPAFSRHIEPTAGQRARPLPWAARTALPRVAAAIALVALTATLLRERPQQDPAAIYADIMQGQAIQTDSLLIVSDSVLPAMSSLPRLYDVEAEADAGSYTN